MIDECLVVEFAVDGDNCPLADLSASVGTSVDCHPPLLRNDGTSLLRFSVSESAQEFATALDDDERIDYLHVVDGGHSITARCLSKQPCVVHDLIDAGFLAESLEYSEGNGFFSGGVVGYDVLRNIIDSLQDTVGVDIKRVYPLDNDEENAVHKRWGLTPAQEEALRVGYEMEYLSVPREVTASDVADELGISKSAFLERLHRGEQQLFSQMFR
jgi:predicted DNA binding protein